MIELACMKIKNLYDKIFLKKKKEGFRKNV